MLKTVVAALVVSSVLSSFAFAEEQRSDVRVRSDVADAQRLAELPPAKQELLKSRSDVKLRADASCKQPRSNFPGSHPIRVVNCKDK